MFILEQLTLFKPAMRYRLVSANELDNTTSNTAEATA